MCIPAAFSMLFLLSSCIHDLTFAILYKPDAQTYYPVALLLWRKKSKAPQVTAAPASSDQVCSGAFGQLFP
jgi:hypothetical protein